MFQQGLPVRASQVSVPIKKWSLIRLHFQFQAVIVEAFDVSDGARQAAAFDSDHDSLGLFEIFRQRWQNANREAGRVVHDLFQANLALGASW